MTALRPAQGRAPVAEVFSSVQGEGPFVGVRQVFVRTYGCDLACRYCDTPASRAETGPCRIESPPGSGAWREVGSPLTAEAVAGLIDELDQPLWRAQGGPRGVHHSVSFTGGEPLLHTGFVAELAGCCRERGLLAYLETNGQRVGDLRAVIDRIDIVAMDVKLPSSQSGCPPGRELLATSLEFLRVARTKQVFAKVIVTPDVSESEVVEVASGLASVSSDLTLVLQPVTPRGDVTASPSARAMLQLQAAAAAHLPDTRVIPQCHLLVGQL